ncbi:ShlB/FhaC/HecB family hemolysin secretion/activation protein [Pseudanabaena sp. BC1403]|uniref:ShlB/FhaC/HecB family hemolysin secretion/activation protein n=1 Tax=Pseudanabaena sp. BC1403 TaxID=2043171 RepID=UPI000CD81DB1|nr:ShlB/FhaC/HecB family hemolysin secretion/activation protein [Pseudanabaena sp. BC1403]
MNFCNLLLCNYLARTLPFMRFTIILIFVSLSSELSAVEVSEAKSKFNEQGLLSRPVSTKLDTSRFPIEQSPLEQPLLTAQRVEPNISNPLQRINPSPSQPVLPPETLPPAPTLDQSIPKVPEDTETRPNTFPAKFFVKQIEVTDSTVFSTEELAVVTKPFIGRELTFAELLQVRSAITQLYTSRGYISSGVIIPPQTLSNGVIKMQAIEGSLEEIKVTGLQHLNPDYIRSRLQLAGAKPLNINQLLEGLQLLKLNPLIENISAELQTGDRPETRILLVEAKEAKNFSVIPTIDNGRSPSVGSFRRQIQLSHANLFGLGDGLKLGYTNTDGSNGFDFSYTLPINPSNGTIQLAAGTTTSNVIESPFDVLKISAVSKYYEATYRQPLILRPQEELAVGLTFSRQESQTSLGIDNIGPFPISSGSDSQGSTRVSALRFFQEWTRRNEQSVMAFRSQFSLGLGGLFNATVNQQEVPDSNFLSWRGQGQWVQLLAPDTLFLLRGDIQIANRTLLTLEQFGLGGVSTVRGYRQEALLTDNGAQISAEVRLPIFKDVASKEVLQLTPFVDAGTGWNSNGRNPNPNTLVGLGVGLLWQQGENLSIRLDWGVPLVNVPSQGNSSQERGLYFSATARF